MLPGLPEDAAIDHAFALLRSGRPQDRDPAVRLLDRCLGRRLERYFLRHKVPPGQAEECVWDVWLKLLQSEFRGETRPIVWIWTIARSILISHHRKARPEFTADDDQWEILTQDLAAPELPAWVRLCVERALLQFEADHPERIEVLRMLAEGWTAQEVGTYFNCAEGAARDRVYRTREKVRSYLEECREESQ